MDQDQVGEILAPFRKQIDEIDDELIALLVRRFQIVRKVADTKAEHNIQVVQATRAETVKDKNAKIAQKKGLDGDFVRALYTLMIGHAHEIEHGIVNAKR